MGVVVIICDTLCEYVVRGGDFFCICSLEENDVSLYVICCLCVLFCVC